VVTQGTGRESRGPARPSLGRLDRWLPKGPAEKVAVQRDRLSADRGGGYPQGPADKVGVQRASLFAAIKVVVTYQGPDEKVVGPETVVRRSLIRRVGLSLRRQ
jgi:hypothetical protein